MQAAVQGLQLGAGAASIQQEQAARDLAIQKAQRAEQNQQLLQAKIGEVMSKKNKSASDFVGLAMLLPEKEAESMRKNWEVLGKERQDNELTGMSEVMSALKSGRGDIASQRLQAQADAARNSGDDQRAKLFETHAEIAKIDPEFALTDLGFKMAAIPGGKERLEGIDKFLETRREEAKAPAELSEAESKAKTAAVGARFAESSAVMDLQKKGWDITKIQNDIRVANQNANIAAMNAKIAREGNELKKKELQLKVDEMAQKRDDMIRDKTATVESARSSMDNLLNTADRILKTPIGVVGSATGPISSRLPTASQDVADFEELIATLGSQAFMSQIPAMKGTGALSEKEGEKLQASLQSLSLRQSPEQLMGNVREAQRLILKARGTLTRRYGVPESVPDTPDASVSADDIDALVKKYAP